MYHLEPSKFVGKRAEEVCPEKNYLILALINVRKCSVTSVAKRSIHTDFKSIGKIRKDGN